MGSKKKNSQKNSQEMKVVSQGQVNVTEENFLPEGEESFLDKKIKAMKEEDPSVGGNAWSSSTIDVKPWEVETNRILLQEAHFHQGVGVKEHGTICHINIKTTNMKHNEIELSLQLPFVVLYSKCTKETYMVPMNNVRFVKAIDGALENRD